MTFASLRSAIVALAPVLPSVAGGGNPYAEEMKKNDRQALCERPFFRSRA